jgi:hypothetical protein
MVTTDRAIHKQVGSLTRQGQLDRIFTHTTQQVRPIVKSDADVSPFAGAKGPSGTDTDEPNQRITTIEAVGISCSRGRRRWRRIARGCCWRRLCRRGRVAGRWATRASRDRQHQRRRDDKRQPPHPDLLDAERTLAMGRPPFTPRAPRIAPAYAAQSVGFRRVRSSGPGAPSGPAHRCCQAFRTAPIGVPEPGSAVHRTIS